MCGRSGGVCQACAFFLGNTSVVLTWAGTGRVDISVQLLIVVVEIFDLQHNIS